jgi:photosystem II stability/assembly factor-like uncharacterized protein
MRRFSIVVLALLAPLFLVACSSSSPSVPHLTTTSAPPPTTTSAPLRTTSTSSPTPARQTLTAIAFFNPKMGYGVFTRQGAVNCQDLVGPTTDGGAIFGPLVPVTSWTCANGASVESLAFDDHGDGFLYGPNLMVTHDGGTTWARSAQPGTVLSVESLGLSVWMLEAECPSPSISRTCALRLFESTDGGRSWSSSSSAPPDAVVDAYAGGQGQTWMVRISQSSAYMLQNVESNPQDQANTAPLWFTTDGGTSWSERSIPCAVVSSDGAGQVISLSAAPDGTLLAVCAGEPGAGSQSKSALRSFNGGATWTVQSSCPIASRASAPGTSCDIFSFGYLGGIDAVSADTVFLYGGRSSLLVSHDGGALWQAVQPLIGDDSGGTQQAIFFNGSDGVVVGEGGDTNEGVTLWSTSDGGTQWTSVMPRTN